LCKHLSPSVFRLQVDPLVFFNLDSGSVRGSNLSIGRIHHPNYWEVRRSCKWRHAIRNADKGVGIIWLIFIEPTKSIFHVRAAIGAEVINIRLLGILDSLSMPNFSIGPQDESFLWATLADDVLNMADILCHKFRGNRATDIQLHH
jgi:hypothetical protein